MLHSNHLENDNKNSALELVLNNGLECLPELLKIVLNEAMKIERNHALGAQPYERTDDRKGYANGFKPKTLNTRVGEVRVSIPQVRGMEFYPACLEKGMRSERALKLAIAQMYIEGVSTRKVTEITRQLCGLDVSSTQVSHCAKLLDDELHRFRTRPLESSYSVLFLDARYEKVRHDKQVIDCAVLIATGINEKGEREVLGVSVALSEAEVHWRTFLAELVGRGLSGLKMIVSDAHAGLAEARKSVFPSVPWQRCQFHFAQNAQSYVPKKNMREEIAQSVRDIFAQKTLEGARKEVTCVVNHYEKSAPEFSRWLENNVEQCLTIYSMPQKWHRKLRTVNGVERVNRELKRRTRVVCIFPNTDSLLRLVSALLAEIHDEWTTSGRAYIKLDD